MVHELVDDDASLTLDLVRGSRGRCLGEKSSLVHVGKARLAAGQNSPVGPPLWLLDEPATGLDPSAIAMLANTVLAHLASEGVAVIASHGGSLDEALGGHADRLNLQELLA